MLLVLEREEGRKKEKGKHWFERDNALHCLPHILQLGVELTSQAYALPRNGTRNLWEYGMTLHPTEPPVQGTSLF